LTPPAETVHDRKAELTVEEIARQRRAYRLLVQGLSGIGRIVDATGAPEETAARAVDVVIGWMAERAARRVGGKRDGSGP
jgi:AmiR/NasT family two-component response regulator